MLQPKKPLKQLIQNAFKKGTEKSEMKKKMPKVNWEKEKFESKLNILNDKPKVKGTGTASSYQPAKVSPKKDTMKEMYDASKIKNNNVPKYKSPNATVSKVNFEREKWEKGLSGNVPMGSGSKSKPSSSSESSYKNRK